MHKTPTRISMMSAAWAVGLVIGGPVGSAFSERITWRWAFLINLPCVGLALFLALFCVPEGRVLNDAKLPISQRLRETDWVPILLNIALPVLFALALTFSGSVWPWNSRAVLGLWLAFGAASLVGVLYLWLKVASSGFLVGGQVKLSMWSLWIGSICAGASYAIALYYLPLYFAFAKGADALEQTKWVLPFVFAFIVSVAVTGRLLHLAGLYKLIYSAGGAVVLAAGATLAVTLRADTSKGLVAGLEAVMGVGVGLLFQHSIGICKMIEKSDNNHTRLDNIFMCNFAQMGGIPVTLVAAASIFQNVGFQLLARDLGSTMSEKQIRELLAGSLTKSQSSTLMLHAANIVSNVIASEFYVVAAAGGLCFVAGVVFATCTRHDTVESKQLIKLREPA